MKIRSKGLQNAATVMMFNTTKDVSEPGSTERSNWRGGNLKLLCFISDAYKRTTAYDHPLRRFAAMLAAYRCVMNSPFFKELNSKFTLLDGFMEIFWQELQQLGHPPTYPSKADRFLIT